MKTLLKLKLIGLMALTPTVFAGSLDPPSAPPDVSSGMYSLQIICDRLDTGVAGSQSAFIESISGPGPTGCTLNNVMTKAPALDNTNSATPADVVNGKTFWGLRSGNWGLQTGTPLSRFTDNSNGTVTDNLTGLIWLKNANCFGTVNWTPALSNANNLASGNCGLTDGSTAGQWRLPNVKELQSLIDFSKFSPALPTGHPFGTVQNGYYWSASSYAKDTTSVWLVTLGGGYVYAGGKMSTYYVWPVRGGQ